MEGYTQYTKLHPKMSSLLTWARADPSPLTRGNCAVTIDQREATGLDLAAEGFNQMYANPDNIEPPPFDQLIAAIASPYRLDIVRRRDYDPDLPEQPAIMGAVWRTPHPPTMARRDPLRIDDHRCTRRTRHRRKSRRTRRPATRLVRRRRHCPGAALTRGWPAP